MRKTVVFDLGGVLIDHDPRYLYRKLLPTEDAVADFLTTVCDHAWNELQDAGRSLADATAERIALFPEKRDLIEAYYARWDEMLNGAIDGTVDIFRDLRAAGKPVYGLSNFSAETYVWAGRHYEFLDWFEGIVVSGQDGLIKPDPDIYRLLLARYGLQAEDLVFVDDREANIRAAHDLGIHGIQFTSPEKLRMELAALGILQAG
ncbi:MAG: HAD family phosphatase [Rhodospirillales bacterium]|nr:HAD family phosphatase [Rhodospirillales bacterium]